MKRHWRKMLTEILGEGSRGLSYVDHLFVSGMVVQAVDIKWKPTLDDIGHLTQIWRRHAG